MSHDRGCFRCNRDIWEYEQCKASDCPKKAVFAMLHKQADIGKRNRERIRDYYSRRPGATGKECANFLGLCHQTVSAHLKVLRAEWRKLDAISKKRS